MKKMFIILTLIIFLLLNIFLKSNVLTTSISFSINLFINNILPSLFPMFIISSILIAIGIPDFLGNIFSKLFKILFKVKGIAAFVFFMSLISGFPSNAKFIKDLLDKKLINEIDANKILTFTFFSNPLFIVNSIGIMFFNNKKIGFLILLSHILSNVFVGIIFRNLYKCSNEITNISLKKSIKELNNKINSTNIIKEFLKSINKSIITLLNVFGTITCFIILVNLIDININPLSNGIIKGLLEITSGLKYISLIEIPLSTKIYLAAFCISFGGLSVHFQIINILNDYKINYFPFVLSRIIHGLISILLIYFILNL